MSAKTATGLICALAVGIGLGVFVKDGLTPAAADAAHSPRSQEALPAFMKREIEPAKGPHVLLISIDTLRADRMSLYGYARKTTPAIEKFAESARVFEKAYSTSAFTSPAVASMLTGYYPVRHRVRLLWQRFEDTTITVADHLRRAGYSTAGIVSNIVLSQRACGLGSRFDHYDDEVDDPPSNRPHLLERRAAPTTDAAIAWLKGIKKTDQPTFLWVHYMDPHGPYDAPADGPADYRHRVAIPLDLASVSPSARLDGVDDAAEYCDRYDEEIAYVDREIGRLLAAYQSSAVGKDAVIILTADHGEYLIEHDRVQFSHAVDVGRGVLHIPLLVQAPGLSPERVSDPVSLADVMPTILQAVDLPMPEDLDGRSLLGSISPRPPYAEGPDSSGTGGLQRTFIYPDRKVVVQHGLSNEPREAWAFDTVRDPDETTPIPVDLSEPAYVVLAEMIRTDPDPGGRPAHYAQGEEPAPLVSAQIDERELKHLRSLGYVE